jgi:branched-chain amino acid transport system permease protein
MIDVAIGTLSTAAMLIPIIFGINLIMRVSGVINFGAGHMCVFAGAACTAWSKDSALFGVAATILASCVIGFLAYLIAVLPAKLRGARPLTLTISTLGFGLVIGWLSEVIFGSQPSTLQPWISGSFTFQETTLSLQRALVVAVSFALALLSVLTFDRTLIGRAMEAVAHSEELAKLYGLRTRVFEFLAWAVGGICLGFGGVFQASLASVSHASATTLLVLGFSGAIVGGLGSLVGSVLGAVVVALGQAIVAYFIDPAYQTTAVFLILFLTLLLRPMGLLPSRQGKVRV